MYFFDSWGGMHETCLPDDPDNGFFGPTGNGRELGAKEVEYALGASLDGRTPWAVADERGVLCRAEDDVEWDTLIRDAEPCSCSPSARWLVCYHCTYRADCGQCPVCCGCWKEEEE